MLRFAKHLEWPYYDERAKVPMENENCAERHGSISADAQTEILCDLFLVDKSESNYFTLHRSIGDSLVALCCVAHVS